MRKTAFILALFLVGCNHYRQPFPTSSITKEEMERRINFINRNPDMTRELKNKIYFGELKVGMTKREVRIILGMPIKEETLNPDCFNDTERMCLQKWEYPQRFVVFRNGILVHY